MSKTDILTLFVEIHPYLFKYLRVLTNANLTSAWFEGCSVPSLLCCHQDGLDEQQYKEVQSNIEKIE